MKYLRLASNFIQEDLIYKARIVIWSIVDIINFIIFPFIWLAVFGSRQQIGGFSRADIVSYYIIMALINFVFSSHLATGIRRYIIEGRLSQYLVRPINYVVHEIIKEIAYRIFPVIIALFLILILKIFFSQYLLIPSSVRNFLFFLLSLIISLALSTTIQLIIGFAVFWFGDTGSLNNLHHILRSVFSGKLAPLVFYPIWLANIADFTPFKYMFYFPFQVYSGKLNLVQIIDGFGIQFIWLVILSSIAFVLFRRGLKIYDGAGI